MTETKTKIEYEIEVPILHRILVERDEVLTNEELWESITEEECFGSHFQDQVESELIYSLKNLDTYDIQIFENGETK
jgi:hypothetical protein